MKDEKKNYMLEKQNYIRVRDRNRKIGLASMILLAIGLGLKYVDMADVGENFIWLGVVMVIYIFGSNMMARSAMSKYEKK
ncbi:hypothetical protein J2755_002267 [Methanohalophilus levihalophilus]|uniref:hypothetical protein n=1 Tax=Methanohalophilus levihalophilus TaxID=1431282 RepID=UPI001AE1053F|nr:hypothetical protein [Methanohalophilus levihalophilus]MBP2031304.1 hypothetical protein [Methanohalophilus levihalophilus]